MNQSHLLVTFSSATLLYFINLLLIVISFQLLLWSGKMSDVRQRRPKDADGTLAGTDSANESEGKKATNGQLNENAITKDAKRDSKGAKMAEDGSPSIFKSPVLPILLVVLPVLVAYTLAKPEPFRADRLNIISDIRVMLSDRISFGPYYSPAGEFPTFPTFSEADYDAGQKESPKPNDDHWMRLRWQAGEWIRGAGDSVDASLLDIP
jgi:hypothetical protein